MTAAPIHLAGSSTASYLRGGAMVDILRTHPMVIVGSILARNPFFVPPERFLPQLRERRAKQRLYAS